MSGARHPTRPGDRLGPHRWGLRYRDANGVRHRKSPFPSKSAAMAHFRNTIEPELRGDPTPMPELTLAELVDLYLDRHAAVVRPRTIATLRDRLRHAIAAFGDVPLRDLERMTDEIAAWQAQLPPRAGHGIAQALRQVLDAAMRWERTGRNPAKAAGRNPKPPPRAVRAFTRAEVDAIAAELAPAYRPLPLFAAATGLRPEEWQALERRDVDRRSGLVHVRRSVSSGEVVDLGKTERSTSAGAVVAVGRGRPRRHPAPARYAARVPRRARRRAQPRQLAAPRVGARRRGRRDSQARAHLRPALDLRQQRPRGRYRRVRAGQGHGHVARDDRAPLRDVARRRHRRGSPTGWRCSRPTTTTRATRGVGDPAWITGAGTPADKSSKLLQPPPRASGGMAGE